jgi:hypothetical protein
MADLQGVQVNMRSIQIHDIYREFADLLDHRFSNRVYTTEDCIRYTMFYCLTDSGDIHPSDVVLEYPHPAVSAARIDTYVAPKEKRPGLAFEFKFDRRIPSGRNPPKTQKAGKVFGDIFRLALFKVGGDVQRYFVYVTDEEMGIYFRNPSNQLVDFFDLEPGAELTIDGEYVNRHPETFVRSVGADVVRCALSCCLCRDFLSGFWVRAYEIKASSSR